MTCPKNSVNAAVKHFNDDKDATNMCLLSPPLYVFQSYVERKLDIKKANKESWKSVEECVRSLLVIMPVLLGFILAQLLCQNLPMHSTPRFFVEFLLIVGPIVCNTTWAVEYNDLYICIVTLLIFLLLWARHVPRPKGYIFQLDKRPKVFTLVRATAYVGTGVAILAVDFDNCFPFDYRKSRTYGASIMDLGIGLFVVTMGLVSHRARTWTDIKKLYKTVVPLLALGLIRTIVITTIGYHQDEHEYGVHLNAFFILGLTKLFGSLLSLLTRSDKQLLPLGVGKSRLMQARMFFKFILLSVILVLHESLQQMGLMEHIIKSPQRNGFFDSNREGLGSLPGSIALYILSIYCAKWYMSKDQLNTTQFWEKLLRMICCALVAWALVVVSAFGFGIARVTFNTGYVMWLLAICITMVLLYEFFFEFALSGRVNSDYTQASVLPSFVEALNMNGLTFFMITNLLTGFVNLTLSPGDRNIEQCVLILMSYMLISSGVVYVLLLRGIRIA